jgi:hypothetical protein
MKPQRHAALLLLALTLGIIPARAQEVHLHGFMDFTASASTQPGSRSAFGLGQYDFYLTGQLAEHISFLGESVFEYDGGFIVDVERVLVAFTPRHYFHVAVGKHHTPIGFWNNAYHHGALMQPTIARAQMFRFEDEGGVLPIHTTGVLISGRDISRLHLGYDVMVGNGIGSTPIEDNDNAKSYTFAAHSQVNSRLRIGASMYFDRIAPGTPDLGGTPVIDDIDVRMFGGFVSYVGPAVELLGEYQRTNHHIRRTGVTRGTDAYYGYGGYRLGKLVPYVRYDELKFPADDPYFVVDDFRQGLLGVRYDLAATVGIKLELARRTTALRGSATVVTAQVAVGF